MSRIACQFGAAAVIALTIAIVPQVALADTEGPQIALADTEIVGDVQHVYDRGVIVVDNQPVQLFGVIAPGVGEPNSGGTQLLLRKATLGRIAHCEVLGGEGSEPLARCMVGAMDLSALLVATGHGRACSVDGQMPYGKLAPSLEASMPALECPS